LRKNMFESGTAEIIDGTNKGDADAEPEMDIRYIYRGIKTLESAMKRHREPAGQGCEPAKKKIGK